MQEIITIMIKHLPDKRHLTAKNQPRIAVLMIFVFFKQAAKLSSAWSL